ncbi:hypothetical protein SEA_IWOKEUPLIKEDIS_41 [Mycobacterium phage Iwokeuplikedis]|nr:hypothetical protein SEA_IWOKEUPLIKEDIS_41 [Mycobacterium phage Iwokeuplikedis]
MRELKQLAAVILLFVMVVFGLTACEGDTGGSTTDTYPHGYIYVPPMGKTPGVGPIFY